MKSSFERTSSHWVRYSEYEWKETEDGTLYLTPAKTAQPSIYDPLTEYQRIVLDAIDIGRMGTGKKHRRKQQFIDIAFTYLTCTMRTMIGCFPNNGF